MPDREIPMNVWHRGILTVFDENGKRITRMRLFNVHQMVRGQKWLTVTAEIETLQEGPPESRAPRPREE